MKRKAQSSIEFAAIMSVMFLIFIIFFYAVSTRLTSTQRDNEISMLEDLGTFLQNELRLATTAEDGYYREFEIPETLNGYDYTINITDYGGLGFSDIILRYVNHSFQYSHVLPVGNVTGSIDKNINTTIKVRKINNVVVVNT